jgi:DtxR family transcriptional regulator, Mn-dependent transcriptional regulator
MTRGDTGGSGTLSGSLEDYLETVYQLVRDHKVARVRDIALARDVRAASVTAAMRRLADLGLVRYEQREYIDLTPEGEAMAREVFSRHQALLRFLDQVLGVSPEQARADACAMEHSLSPQGMDHLVRFFEFLAGSPEGQRLLELFHAASGSGSLMAPSANCPAADAPAALRLSADGQSVARVSSVVRVSSLESGARGHVVQVVGGGLVRERVLGMGLLPDVTVEVTKTGPGADEVAIRSQGFELFLSGEEARAVLVSAEERG